MSNESVSDLFGEISEDELQDVLGASGSSERQQLPDKVRGVAEIVTLEEHFWDDDPVPTLRMSGLVIEGNHDDDEGENKYAGCYINKTMYLKESEFSTTAENLKKIVNQFVDLGFGDVAKELVSAAFQSNQCPWESLRDNLFPVILDARPQFEFRTYKSPRSNDPDKVRHFFGKAVEITVNSAAVAEAPVAKELTLKEMAALADGSKANDDQLDALEDAASAAGVDIANPDETWASIVQKIEGSTFEVNQTVEFVYRRKMRNCLVKEVGEGVCTLTDLESGSEYKDIPFEKLS